MEVYRWNENSKCEHLHCFYAIVLIGEDIGLDFIFVWKVPYYKLYSASKNILTHEDTAIFVLKNLFW